MKNSKLFAATAFAFAMLAGSVMAEEKSSPCCDKAKAAGKECEHKCCVEAKAEGKDCEKCSKPKDK